MLILGRTSWHYDEGRRAAAARPPQARRCARVSDKVAGRAVPDLSNARPLRRVPVALRSHALRAASRRHYPRVRVALVGDTHSSRAVQPTGACRAPATNAAGWVWVQSAASTKRGWQAPLTSPFRHATRPSQARLVGAPGETRKRCHTTLVPILHQVKVKRSYQPCGQGRRPGNKQKNERRQHSHRSCTTTTPQRAHADERCGSQLERRAPRYAPPARARSRALALRSGQLCLAAAARVPPPRLLPAPAPRAVRRGRARGRRGARPRAARGTAIFVISGEST